MQQQTHVAYIMSRFPKISETFILYEIVELQRQGVDVEIFPLLRQREHVTHAEAEALVQKTHYSRPLSWEMLEAQVYWLVGNPRGYLQAWFDAIRYNAASRKFLLRALAVVPTAALMAKRMRRLRIQHVHAHWATHPALAAYVIRLLTGLPYSFTSHAHDIYVERERSMLKEKIRDAAFTVTISDYNLRLLDGLFGAAATDKTHVIHCGVDLSVFQPPADRPAGDPFTIVCVGALEEKKGQQHLIDACARLRDAGRHVRCLLIGEGDDRAELEAQIARHGLGDTVTLLGFQPRAEVSRILADADAVVMPSVVMASGKQEGIPVALMEALAVERPAVATNISGIPELIVDGETGLLVPERDSAAIAAALTRLMDNPDLCRQLGTAGRAKVLREFDLHQTVGALRALLER